MSSKVKITWNPDAEEILKKLAMEQVEKNGIDLACPNCNKKTHLSFSGDVCQFCGCIINYGIDPDV